ncbi:MAG: PaaI family thioesterase [Dehalococcoidia bacterium]|uniref:PaaI family thioesterase n=1 Tax=Candidatus Amarobacter glycogenicus TaxID=3140699 RepID=UPI001D588274|nr:PaaI family thioesterase [Dehalococcoidia bacterium]MBK7724781.1 PaaI family thioesterase [Dehalococcoidia bacterium]MBK9544460.1 PaaI family thioesterase [Dehalococcoidia bacterium]MCC6266094.1 PaaI family thioesterase [Dehalococcoidia bacterium]
MNPRPRGQTIEQQRERFAALPLYRQLGLTLEDVRAGFARVVMETGPVTLGGIGGSVHGGLLAALVDIAMLEAVIPALAPSDEPAGTADLNITYMRPVHGTRAIAEATVLRKGKTLAVTEVTITDDAGRLCSKGRAIYVIRQRPAEMSP